MERDFKYGSGEKISEPVDTLVLFEGKSIRPLRFRWRGTAYRFTEITARWQSREGIWRMRHFAGLDHSANYFHLKFDAQTGLWSLVNMQRS